MKVSTTFWSEKVHDFSLLFFINSNNNEILFKTDLNDIPGSYIFFQQISQFIISRKIKNNYATKSYEDRDCYQFAVWFDDKICPIKWFDLIINNEVTLHHDIAFSTTMIHRNKLIIPFGCFPSYSSDNKKKYPKYREFNIKSRCYKYMANQIKVQNS